MSIYTEFSEDIERRRARLARAQFWFRAYRSMKRRQLTLSVLFGVAFFILLATLLGAGIVKQ